MLAAFSVVQCSEVAMELSCTLALPIGRVCLCAKRKQLFIKKVLPKGLAQLRAIDAALLSDVQIKQQIRWQT